MSRHSFSWVLLPLVALVVVVSVSFAPPARAEDTTTTQPYADLLNLEALRELGISDKDITIALIDGPVDTSAPELQGADITIITPCPYTPTPDSISHETAMTPLLASPGYGIAPGATIINYATPLRGEDLAQEDRRCATGFTRTMTLTLNDDADITSYSVGGNSSRAVAPALTKANLNGATVVTAMGNNNQEDYVESCASSSPTVGVAAIDIHGSRADYSNYGKETTATLYGGPVSTRDCPSGGAYHETRGTSVTTALTSGYLTLAMEKWPEATSRQILQSLVRTAVRGDGVEWDPGYGYRLANLHGLLTEDPTNLPDENPLLYKNTEWPPSEEYCNNYVDGLFDLGDEVITDPHHIYQGLNSNRASLTPEKTTYSTSPRYHRAPNTPPTPPPNRHHRTP